ncbi:Uncharacterized protein Fot_25262 [Forsythia ovata]|uniref:Uncharacterized protein n=1 Tax=Forsythia ovata TaxID=205694 RepID=A0ABD1U8I8_9LAMI
MVPPVIPSTIGNSRGAGRSGSRHRSSRSGTIPTILIAIRRISNRGSHKVEFEDRQRSSSNLSYITSQTYSEPQSRGKLLSMLSARSLVREDEIDLEVKVRTRIAGLGGKENRLGTCSLLDFSDREFLGSVGNTVTAGGDD